MRSTSVSSQRGPSKSFLCSKGILVVDLAIYPVAFFNFAMAVGLYLVRLQRRKVGLGRAEFKAWHVALIFTIIVNLFLLVMPWYPPRGGAHGGDVSFWYKHFRKIDA